MKYLLLLVANATILLLASTARAAPLVGGQDLAPMNNVIHNSSCTYNFGGNVAVTSPVNFAVAFATVTITTTGTAPLRIWYTGWMDQPLGTRLLGVSYIINGGFDTNFTAKSMIVGCMGTGWPCNGSFSYVTLPKAAGTYNIGLTVISDVGTSTICRSINDNQLDNDALASSMICQFCVEQVQ